MAIEAIWYDVRHALRTIRRAPRFATLAVATLALGIGVNTAAFGVAYGILVRPLPYAEPSRLVVLNLLFADGGDLGFSPRALQEWLPRLRTVDVAAGYYRRELTVRAGARSTVLPAAVVTDRFFDVLGTAAEAGQARVRVESPEVVLGRRRIAQVFGTSALESVLGASVAVSDSGHIVGGVMSSDFAFPDDDIGVWVPSRALLPGTKPENAGYSKIVARMKPGVTLEQVRDDANRIRLELNPKSREAASVVALGASVVGGMRTLLIAAVAGALLVLLVACANVATLFIGRDVARQRELAARVALGAARSQLVRGIFVETMVVALAASVAGLLLGAAALKIFVTEASGTISGLHRVGMDAPTALAIAALTIVVTSLCGAVPAWHAARGDLSPFLRPTAGSRPRAWHVRRALVVAQVAGSCVLLIGAGLLGRTVSILAREDHGFRPDGALEAKVVLSDTILFEGAGRAAFVQDLLDRVRAMPGVQHAGFGTSLPPHAPPITIAIRLVEGTRDETRFMKVVSATPGYLRALGTRFVAGRDFHEDDNPPGAPVVILSESVARFYFPHDDPVGRTISRLPALFGMTAEPRVVGVVRDVKFEGLDSPAGGAIYVPWVQRPLGRGYLIVRTADDPLRLAPDVRLAAHAIDPTVPVPEVQPLQAVIAQSIANRRLRALPAAGFGVLALTVAFVGLLATLSTFVAERGRDLAIRSALGASPGHLVRMIVGQGLALTASGLIAA